ncbi:glycosyltransferase family 2 protein [Oceanomicrobium pacificus]|uniref:Glycosyltransferase n=1 Tax=Oceanomicrobium pacificus TaxID=2692916 RepID=A0A6B0U0K5_9RHOB|nr:glycosyltransferase [Oceanomicrobium pacificus]MXU64661.1 glycosyltransferase [Oceanomicrobium pacificus]
MPFVSVIIPAFNGADFIREAMESVLSQSFSDFELIVVDDASTDSTPEILADFELADRRIRLLKNEKNLGVTRSLNVGLHAATGKYVARLDADDVCLPNRLERQVEFLENHPDHEAVACGYRLIDANGRTIRVSNRTLDDWQIRWVNGFYPPAAAPTYFFRRVKRNGDRHFYDESFPTAEDFAFWSTLSAHGKMHLFGEPLVKYRRHANANTALQRLEQVKYSRVTSLGNLNARLPAPLVEGLEPLLQMFTYQRKADPDMIRAAVAGCDALLQHDLDSAPTSGHRSWLRRMTASLLADACLTRGEGIRGYSTVQAFLLHGRRHLPYLVSEVARQPRLALKSLKGIAKT